jgi:enamine deaminase RidA (YjgF/YER057c/UK114 family)
MDDDGRQPMSVEDRIVELGFQLGDPPRPLGEYVRCVVADGFAFTAGHGPFDEHGTVTVRGQVGRELSLEEGQEAARRSVVSCLASLKSALGSLDEVDRIVKMLAFVNCAPGFTDTSAVIDGASELLVHAFGTKGVHARAAIGTTVLPGGIPVEIELIAKVHGPVDNERSSRHGN